MNPPIVLLLYDCLTLVMQRLDAGKTAVRRV
jgi:hypothetical protein